MQNLVSWAHCRAIRELTKCCMSTNVNESSRLSPSHLPSAWGLCCLNATCSAFVAAAVNCITAILLGCHHTAESMTRAPCWHDEGSVLTCCVAALSPRCIAGVALRSHALCLHCLCALSGVGTMAYCTPMRMRSHADVLLHLLSASALSTGSKEWRCFPLLM